MFVSFEPTFGSVRCLNNDPKFDVTIKSKDVELKRVNYKPEFGHHSFEAMSQGMTETIILNNQQVKEYKCDRMIEEFLKSIGMPINFAELGAKEEDIPAMVEHLCKRESVGGFVKIGAKEAEAIYRLAL